jgi:hypothetical protein
VLLGGLAVALGIGSGASGDGIALGSTGSGPTTTIPAYDLNGDGNADIATVDGQTVAVPQPADEDDNALLAWAPTIGVIGAATARRVVLHRGSPARWPLGERGVR